MGRGPSDAEEVFGPFVDLLADDSPEVLFGPWDWGFRVFFSGLYHDPGLAHQGHAVSDDLGWCGGRGYDVCQGPEFASVGGLASGVDGSFRVPRMAVSVVRTPSCSLKGSVFYLDRGSVGKYDEASVAVPFSLFFGFGDCVVFRISWGHLLVARDVSSFEVTIGVPWRDAALP